MYRNETFCVHVYKLHPGANLHPGVNLHHLESRSKFAPGCKLHWVQILKTPFTWPKKTPRAQIPHMNTALVAN